MPDAPEFEDVGHVLLRLRDGTVGSFEASWLTPNAAPYHGDCRAIFTGTEGTIEVLSVQKKVIVTNVSHVGHEAPLVSCDRVEDDFLRGIAEGVDRMVLPPQEALESTRWSLMARTLPTKSLEERTLRRRSLRCPPFPGESLPGGLRRNR